MSVGAAGSNATDSDVMKGGPPRPGNVSKREGSLRARSRDLTNAGGGLSLGLRSGQSQRVGTNGGKRSQRERRETGLIPRPLGSGVLLGTFSLGSDPDSCLLPVPCPFHRAPVPPAPHLTRLSGHNRRAGGTSDRERPRDNTTDDSPGVPG